MKKGNYFSILCAVLFMSLVNCTRYPAYEITDQPFVNNSSLDMYIGDEVQLTASPVDSDFRWLSDNESVARVSQTGLVTAVSEGFASIAVTAGGVEVKVDVRVRTFIHVTDISLSITSLTLYVGNKSQIWAYAVPENASVTAFTWRSENPEVATVDKDGIVTAIARGVTNIIVALDDMEKTVPVTVYEVHQLDRTGWTATSRNGNHNWGTGGGGQPNLVLDGNRNTGWHSTTSAPLPQCLVVDMQESYQMDYLMLWHLPNGLANSWIYFRTIEVYLSDAPVTPDVYQSSWGAPVATYEYPGGFDGITIKLNPNSRGRYLVLYFPDSRTSTYISFAELEVYSIVE
ncbi:MAG: Ig-like domain-containing protein [Tannerella sp.]|jgi:hypothetical protein|nr:Ig-like domain-containing protein [Tannerella sp.]